MKIKWDDVSKTFSVASEMYVLSERHFKKNETKPQKVQPLTFLPPSYDFFIIFGKKTSSIAFFLQGKCPLARMHDAEKSPSSCGLNRVERGLPARPVHPLE